MNEIIHFLRDLQQNNNREWFNENKQRYVEAQKKWNSFCEELINEVGKFDESIASLSVKDCTYRIYRDTRFSHDKTPYKTHFGAFLCPGGKKSMHAGYYFHLSTCLDDEGNPCTEYPFGLMVASGNYCYDQRAIKILREDISEGWDDFCNNVIKVADPMFYIDMEGALKKVPKGYDTDAPYADWMRLRSYCLNASVNEKFVTAPHLATRLAKIFKTTKPFNDYINRAIDYINEGND